MDDDRGSCPHIQNYRENDSKPMHCVHLGRSHVHGLKTFSAERVALNWKLKSELQLSQLYKITIIEKVRMEHYVKKQANPFFVYLAIVFNIETA